MHTLAYSSNQDPIVNTGIQQQQQQSIEIEIDLAPQYLRAPLKKSENVPMITT
jgi:hypothetical protein